MFLPTELLMGAGTSTFALRYLIPFLCVIVEGPITMVASGFLLRQGVFSLPLIVPVLIVGDLLGDLFWYFVGRYGASPFLVRYGKFLGITEETLQKVRAIFRRYDSRIIFLSKITMGFGFALGTLITAGMVRVPFRKYLWFNFLGGLVWTSMLVGLGYLLGRAYTVTDTGFRAVWLVASIVLVAAALYGFGTFIRKKLASRL